MPRPRKASDDDVFAATTRAMQRLGPADLTLGAIAEEAGVTAAALVQRFGSKRALLVAMSRAMARGTGDMLADLRTAHPSPLAAIRAYVGAFAHLAASPEALARNLAYLQLDLTDPELHAPLRAHARASRRGLRRLVSEAMRDGELCAGAKAADLARLIETTLNGSLMTWAVHRQGTAAAWLRHDLELVLAPWQPRRRTRA